MEDTRNYYFQKGFPGVYGIIDGTHIKIGKPLKLPKILQLKKFLLHPIPNSL